MEYYIGIDLGGTTMKGGLIESGRRIGQTGRSKVEIKPSVIEDIAIYGAAGLCHEY